ncbi:MAG TPA: hypothetical protein H9881_09870 [Candidatus Stackebrandtia excrementipullorum]|nr:hypothetical protein [Candidatus Stackebrandtia excrementipullorum]
MEIDNSNRISSDSPVSQFSSPLPAAQVRGLYISGSTSSYGPTLDPASSTPGHETSSSEAEQPGPSTNHETVLFPRATDRARSQSREFLSRNDLESGDFTIRRQTVAGGVQPGHHVREGFPTPGDVGRPVQSNPGARVLDAFGSQRPAQVGAAK